MCCQNCSVPTQPIFPANTRLFPRQNGLGLVDHKVQIAKQYLSHSKQRAASDWELLNTNNAYVMRWSLIQVCVVVATGCLQVFFVRKLFDTQTKSRGRI